MRVRRNEVRKRGHAELHKQLEIMKALYPEKFPTEERIFKNHSSRQPDLHRHGVRGAAVPGQRAHQLCHVQSQGLLRHRAAAGLDPGRGALRGREVQGDLPAQLLLHRQQHPRSGQPGAGGLHADLPLPGARPVPEEAGARGRGADPDVAAGRARLHEPRHQRRHREGRRRERRPRHRPGERTDAPRAGRHLHQYQGRGLHHALRRAAPGVRGHGGRRHRPEDRQLCRAHRPGRRHDPGGLRQHTERDPRPSARTRSTSVCIPSF